MKFATLPLTKKKRKREVQKQFYFKNFNSKTPENCH